MSKDVSGRIDFLDYMRIFAFASVLLGHLFHQELRAASADPSISLAFQQLAGIIYDVCYAGAVGVIVFFLVSGYIITHVVRVEHVFDFFVRRIFRIYPLFVSAVLLQIVVDKFVGGVALPELKDIIPRLLLVGDFFGVPYSLGGVEWTLRVEVIFYLFMMLMKVSGLFNMPRFVPLFFVGLSFALCFIAPFPKWAGWTDGYLNLFFPFLLSGVVFYLYEKKLAGMWCCIFAVATMLSLSLWQLPKLHPVLARSNFEVIALAIFLVVWIFRDRIRGNVYTSGLSDMTYAIYLTHLWLWPYLDIWVRAYGLSYISADVQRLVVLFVMCYVMSKTIEKFGVSAGRAVVKKLRAARSSGSLGAAAP